MSAQFQHPLVESVEIGQGVFVYLKPGNKLGSDFSQDGNQCQHCFGEDSIAKVEKTLENDIYPCDCDYCRKQLGK